MQRRQMTVGRPKTKRQLREYVCGRKRGYPTRQQAMYELKHLAAQPDARDPERLGVYKCGWCPDFHVGHQPKKKAG
jgi:hypothetical protein